MWFWLPYTLGAIVKITLDTCIIVVQNYRFDFCRINSLVFLIFATQIFASALPQADSANILAQECIQLQIKGWTSQYLIRQSTLKFFLRQTEALRRNF